MITTIGPSLGSVWRHTVTRTQYTVIAVTNTESTLPHKWPVMAVYRDGTGATWSRDVSSFYERMEYVSPADETVAERVATNLRSLREILVALVSITGIGLLVAGGVQPDTAFSLGVVAIGMYAFIRGARA